jgi:hypothetical protein
MFVWKLRILRAEAHDHVALEGDVGLAPGEELPMQVRVTVDHHVSEEQSDIVNDRVPLRQ